MLELPFNCKLHWPFHDGGRYHIETSPLICSANQWTGFYMITASVMKGLKHLAKIVSQKIVGMKGLKHLAKIVSQKIVEFYEVFSPEIVAL